MKRHLDYVIFGHMFTVTADMLDELGHANYNALKEPFENARHRLLKFLGFGRKTLRQRLQIGLFMKSDAYTYAAQLKNGDLVMTLPFVRVKGAATIEVELRFVKIHDHEMNAGGMTLTNTAVYTMVMAQLKSGRPTRLPKELVKAIADYTAFQKEYYSPLVIE